MRPRRFLSWLYLVSLLVAPAVLLNAEQNVEPATSENTSETATDGTLILRFQDLGTGAEEQQKVVEIFKSGTELETKYLLQVRIAAAKTRTTANAQPLQTVALDKNQYKRLESELLSLILEQTTLGMTGAACKPALKIELLANDEETTICASDVKAYAAARAIMKTAAAY